MGLLVAGVLLFVGGLFALRVAIGVTKQEVRLSGGKTVSGQVVAINTRQSRQRGRTVTYTFPVLRFSTIEGVEYEREAQYSWAGGREGQQVQVRYAPEDPTLCRVASSKLGPIGTVLAWVATAAFLAVGVALALNGLSNVF